MTAARRFVRPRVRVAQGADWAEQAACVGRDPELWFSHDPAVRDHALAICHTCPVRTECLAAAHAEGDTTYPVRGGVDFITASNAEKKGRVA